MTAGQFVLRPALTGDLDAVMALLGERVDWLRSQGSDQWSSWTSWSETKIEPALVEGHVWLLLDAGEPIGTITVEFQGDPDFWTSLERTEPAAYLSKLAVRLDRAGRELGTLLTGWASDHAYRRGCAYVRLDAWKTNERLHAYYAARGWKHLRTVDTPGRNSGALFQLPVRPLPRAQQALLREQPQVTILEGTRSGPLDPAPDVAGNWRPHHVHTGGISYHDEVLHRPAEALFVDFMRYRLRHTGNGWRLDAVDGHFTDWRHQGLVLDVSAELDATSTYVVTHQELIDTCRMVVMTAPAEPVPEGRSTSTDRISADAPHEP